MKHTFLLCFLAMLFVGCATPITREEAQNITYTCADVDVKLAQLIEEREKNNKRILSGVRSIVPVGAIVNVFRGRYRENVAIATGEWSRILDNKIAEMRHFKSQC